ncbi:NUDIX hydrolase [Scytonema sp. NUACC26]|uniref:NUDIX hydrolase n=1 Tax=Scytonema sp. NUACC26 TaxID=3140176 RepID=UPI0034DBFDF6
MYVSPWKTLESRYIHSDKWLTLRADRCLTPEGYTIDPYYVIEAKEWVNIFAINKQYEVLITRQYRHGAGVVCYELPCGEVEETDMSVVEAAKRELFEETGCEAARIELVGSSFANPARQTNRVHSFICYDTTTVREPSPDDNEVLDFQFIAIDELFKLIEDGTFSQSLHLASVFLALRRMKATEYL